MTLAGSYWPDLDGGRPMLLVPLGACEQHGPHLPLDTDTRIATAVAERAATEALVAPPIGYGASGEHEEFPGTVSVGTEALRDQLLEYGRSACRWAGRLLLVNGHGGNLAALRSAVPRLRYEGRDVAWFACDPGGDAHAGHTETALMLAIDPAAVRWRSAGVGNTAPLRELMPRLRAGELRAAAPSGVLGDPTGATAATGHRLLADLATALDDAVRRWRPDETGRLR